jgi:hypothetical protein
MGFVNAWEVVHRLRVLPIQNPYKILRSWWISYGVRRYSYVGRILNSIKGAEVLVKRRMEFNILRLERRYIAIYGNEPTKILSRVLGCAPIFAEICLNTVYGNVCSDKFYGPNSTLHDNTTPASQGVHGHRRMILVLS